MKPPPTFSRLLSLTPLYFPRALGGLDDRLRAQRLMRGTGPWDITVVRRPTLVHAGLLMFELRRGASSVVVKHPRNAHGVAATARERKVLQALEADERLEPWRSVLPRAVGAPVPSGALAQNRLPGTAAVQVLRNSPHDPHRAAVPALALWAELRAATGVRRAAAERAWPWWEWQLAVLAAGIPGDRSGRRAAELEALRHRLRAALADAVLTEGWTHGDYHPGNVLLAGKPARVTGVFDWGAAVADGPCEIDAYTFVLAVRRIRTGRSLGDLVAETLRDGLPDADRALLTLCGLDPDRDIGDPSALPLLTWLWHVTGNLHKSPRFGHSHWWLANTVTPVLRASARGTGVGP